MARGGRRAGTPGTAYPNRSDLNGPARPLTPSAPAGQPYGQAGAQLAAQKSVPMAAPGATISGPPGGTSAPAGPPPVAPGGLGAFNRPTERPGEPVTAGVPSGAGPGPGAIPGFQQPIATLGNLLSSMAAQPNATPEVGRLASFVQQGRM